MERLKSSFSKAREVLVCEKNRFWFKQLYPTCQSLLLLRWVLLLKGMFYGLRMCLKGSHKSFRYCFAFVVKKESSWERERLGMHLYIRVVANSVSPELAKIDHFGKMSKVFSMFSWFRICQNSEPTLSRVHTGPFYSVSCCISEMQKYLVYNEMS